jgi:hypothetical protein
MDTTIKATKSAKPTVSKPKAAKKPAAVAIPFEAHPKYVECQKDRKPIEALFEEFLANTEENKTIFLDIYGVDAALIAWLLRLLSKDNIVRVQCRLTGQASELEEGVTCGEIHESTMQKNSFTVFSPLVPFGKKATNKLWKNKIVFDTDTYGEKHHGILCLNKDIAKIFREAFSCVPGGGKFFNAEKLFERGAMWADAGFC